MRELGRRSWRWGSIVVMSGLALAGCQPADVPGGTPVPTQSESSPEQETYGPDEGRPVTTDGAEPAAPASPSEAPGPTTSQAVEVRIGDDDYSDLEWSVSCSGLDTSPTVIASAADESMTEYVIVVIGAGTEALATFTFTQTGVNDTSRDHAGLTVIPGGGQGNGSLRVEGGIVSSTGRGVSYDDSTVQPTADMTYAVAFFCAG